MRKTDYNTKTTLIENKLNNHNHDKYISTPEFNTLAADAFNARLKQANLVTKTNYALSSLNNKIGKSNFDKDGTQKYLAFSP